MNDLNVISAAIKQLGEHKREAQFIIMPFKQGMIWMKRIGVVRRLLRKKRK